MHPQAPGNRPRKHFIKGEEGAEPVFFCAERFDHKNHEENLVREVAFAGRSRACPPSKAGDLLLANARSLAPTLGGACDTRAQG
jgi:hypothetical protein